MTINFEDKVINYIVAKELFGPNQYNNLVEVYEIINNYILDSRREVPANEEIRICYDITIKCILEKDDTITVYANVFQRIYLHSQLLTSK